MPSHKNIELNQSVFGSYIWASFPQNQSAGSYFAMFLFAGFYCIYHEEFQKLFVAGVHLR